MRVPDSMMGAEGLRRYVRDAIKIALATAYVHAIIGGLFVTITPPTSYAWVDIALQGLWTAGWMIGGTLALIGVIAGRHRWEMLGCWLVGAGTSVYVTLSWMTVWEKGTVHLPRAAILTVGALLLIARALILLDRNLQARDRLMRQEEASQ